MPISQPGLRPRLTLAILLYAIIDVAGMVFFATGAMWFVHGKPLFIPGFPGNMFEAGGAIAGGLLLMFWAAAQILRELLRQPDKKYRDPVQK